MRRFLRWLLWVYDGKPDPSRPDPMFVVVGWGPVRLPGEKARIQRIEDETKAMLDFIGPPMEREKLEAQKRSAES